MNYYWWSFCPSAKTPINAVILLEATLPDFMTIFMAYCAVGLRLCIFKIDCYPIHKYYFSQIDT